MQEAQFTGLFGALTDEHRLDVIANNLANANTAGYKRDHLAFKDTMIQFAHDQIMEPVATVRSKPLFPEPQLAARVRVAATKVDWGQGNMQPTGNALDLAISGDGFFRVRSPQGDYLTRNGAFSLAADGRLMTKQGWPVLGVGGDIIIPDGTRTVHVSFDGRVFADGLEVGALQINTVSDFRGLEKVGGDLYRLQEGTESFEVPAIERGALVNQGFLEAANVNVVEEMVKMIEVSRHFEACTKVMQTSNTLDQHTYNKIGRPR